jgi:predicted outer membrane repeat protein
MRRVSICAVGLAVAAAGAEAGTIYVSVCGSDASTGATVSCGAADGPKRTIQAAIGAAVNNDVIVALDGPFEGPIVFPTGRALTLRSAAGLVELVPMAADQPTLTTGSGTTLEGLLIRGPALVPAVACYEDVVTLRGCVFENCPAGAVREEFGRSTIDRCVFRGNAAPIGGAVYSTSISLTVSNCLFEGNTAGQRGGAVAYGAVATSGSIINCTFRGNSAPLGPAVSRGSASPQVRNSILWGNSGAATPTDGIVAASHSIIQGGMPGGTAVLNVDPRFAAGGQLMPDSPAVDAGDNTRVPTTAVLDASGGARFRDRVGTPNTGVPGGAGGTAVVDMGAFEFAGLCDGDFDCDGDTATDADIEAFFACLAGACPPGSCGSGADFNGDGDAATDADIESFFSVLGGGSC